MPGVAKPLSSVTLTTTVLDRLRHDILTGALPPGEKLRLEHLTDRYGSGRTPLREACSRLAAEGLVVASEQRGFRVAPVSRADLLDLTRTRQRVESMALRDAIALGDAAWEASVRAAHEALRAAPDGPRAKAAPDGPRARAKTARPALSRAWEARHRDLHLALLGGCGSPWLMRFFALLYDQSERYRRLSHAVEGPPRDVECEHAALVRAALERDAERAAALLVEHIALTTERVLRAHPEPSEALSTKRSGA